MVTRSEWIRSVLSAWDGDECPLCGRPHPAQHVDDEGYVWSYCPWRDRDVIVAHEPMPPYFDPDLSGLEDLPF